MGLQHLKKQARVAGLFFNTAKVLLFLDVIAIDFDLGMLA